MQLLRVCLQKHCHMERRKGWCAASCRKMPRLGNASGICGCPASSPAAVALTSPSSTCLQGVTSFVHTRGQVMPCLPASTKKCSCRATSMDGMGQAGAALLLLLVRRHRRKVLEHLRLLQQEGQPSPPALLLRRAQHSLGLEHKVRKVCGVWEALVYCRDDAAECQAHSSTPGPYLLYDSRSKHTSQPQARCCPSSLPDLTAQQYSISSQMTWLMLPAAPASGERAPRRRLRL